MLHKFISIFNMRLKIIIATGRYFVFCQLQCANKIFTSDDKYWMRKLTKSNWNRSAIDIIMNVCVLRRLNHSAHWTMQYIDLHSSPIYSKCNTINRYLFEVFFFYSLQSFYYSATAADSILLIKPQQIVSRDVSLRTTTNYLHFFKSVYSRQTLLGTFFPLTHHTYMMKTR